MMDVNSNDFIPLARIAIRDTNLQQAVAKGTSMAFNNRKKAMFSVSDEHGEALRQQAAEAKRRALRQLPDLLEQAEANLTANGIQVLWATDATEANQHVLDIAQAHSVKSVAKSKSMMTEEIGLNGALEAAGLTVVETDLGEYIIQLNNEHPSHIIAPVIHKTKESIRDLFIDKLNMPPTDDTKEMVTFARKMLREVFLNADMGITGGNFVIAETGSICLVMNEGNGRMVTAMPKVHVAVIGIEKVIENIEDYATLTQILPRSGTGQQMPVYTNIINGPCTDGSGEGPEQVYVIFVDNGRSDIYATKYAEALACIRCGACLNACPVYRSTGGHAYGWVYGGPIGAVLTPLYVGLENATPLPHASSLCGSCKQVCPVNIDLPRMLLDLRDDLVTTGEDDRRWRWSIKGWAMVNKSPRLFELAGRAARFGLNSGLADMLPSPLGEWKKYRDFPEFAEVPFRELWEAYDKGRTHEQS